MLQNQYKTLALITFSALLAACGGSGGSDSSGAGLPVASIAERYQGIWLAEAYGRVFEINESSLRVLDYSSDFCLLRQAEEGVSTADIEQVLRRDGDHLEDFGNNGTGSFSAPGERFKAAQALPPSCQQGLTATVDDADYQRDSTRDLALYAQLLEEYSVYPALRGVDIALLHDGLAGQVSADSSDEQLVEALYQLTLPLADIHTTVSTPVGVIQVANKPTLEQLMIEEYLIREAISPPLTDAQVQAINAYVSQSLERDREVTLSYAEQASAIKQGGQGLLTWYTRDALGYLAIDAMTGFASEDDNAAQLQALDDSLDQALADLQDVEALIIDVRRNGGGRDFLSLAIASRFAANSTLAYRKQARLGSGRSELRDVMLDPRGAIQFLKPVVLLTSASTVSSAEVFTLAMRSLPQVTLIGEATQGALSDKLEKVLSNGFEVGLANEYYLSPEGDWFESMGIPVQVQVSQHGRELRELGVDAGLEAAAAFLLEE